MGAQLIAESLGSKTTHSPQPEVGEFSVELLPLASSDPVFSQFTPHFPAMHMHYDMVGLPEHAVLLAKSMGCPHQAFKIGDRAYALQFHLEMTRADLED